MSLIRFKILKDGFVDKNNSNGVIVSYVQNILITHFIVYILDLQYLLHLIYTFSISNWYFNIVAVKKLLFFSDPIFC